MKNLQLSRAHVVLMDGLEQGVDQLRYLAVVFGQNLRGPPMRVCRIDQQRQTDLDRRRFRNGLPPRSARSRGWDDRDCG